MNSTDAPLPSPGLLVLRDVDLTRSNGLVNASSGLKGAVVAALSFFRGPTDGPTGLGPKEDALYEQLVTSAGDFGPVAAQRIGSLARRVWETRPEVPRGFLEKVLAHSGDPAQLRLMERYVDDFLQQDVTSPAAATLHMSIGILFP